MYCENSRYTRIIFREICVFACGHGLVRFCVVFVCVCVLLSCAQVVSWGKSTT